MRRERAYLIYPFTINGSALVEGFKAQLKRRYDVLDPFEVVGIGDDARVAEGDLELIDEADTVIAFLPRLPSPEAIQSGMEIMYAFMKGKKVKVYSGYEGPFFKWLEKRGVDLIYLSQ